MHFNAHINPSPTYAMAMGEAIQNNNEGLALKQSGMYDAAEQKYLKALDLKLKNVGENAITTALSHNALGELYIAMNRLDDAEKHLKLAVKIRNADGPTFDAATSRENLAVIYEMRGDLKAAKQMRKSTGKYACGNYDVRSISRLLLIASEANHPYSVPDKFLTRASLNTVENALYASISVGAYRQSAHIKLCRLSITAPRDAR
jgi:tetratricopeptide (TPR) repeat protein